MSPVVGVVGADFGETVRAAGGEPLVTDATAVVEARPDVVVALGEGALSALVAAGVEAPVLPVDVNSGVGSVPAGALKRALGTILAGDHTLSEHPLLRTDRGTRAVFDCMLVTAEPARISEYTVHSGGDRVARFRADGVVVATPAGSCGYARRAGGPVVAPGTGVVAIVPVAPFSTDADNWVVAPDALQLTVERDDAPVELLADDRVVGEVAAGDPVEFGTNGRLRVAVVPESEGPFT